MPNRCVVWGCSSTPNPKEGIFLFAIPFFNDNRPEAKRRRRTWVKFVNQKRKNFFESKGSSICSKHFRPEDLSIRYALLPGHEKPQIPRLKRDEFGVCVYPTIQAGASFESEGISQRKRRKTIKTALDEYDQQKELEVQAPSTSKDRTNTSNDAASVHLEQREDTLAVPPTVPVNNDTTASSPALSEQEDNLDVSTDPMPVKLSLPEKTKTSCKSCSRLKKEKTCWRQRWRIKKNQVDEKEEQLECANQRILQLEAEITALKKSKDLTDQDDQHGTVKTEKSDWDDCCSEEDNMEDEFPCPSDDDDDDNSYMTETESEEEPLTEEEIADKSEKLSMHGKNLRTEPKHIVFLSQLLLLFSFCHSCKADGPMVEANQNGTEVVISTTCRKPKCPKKEFTWHSQPSMLFTSGQRGPAGNFLLSMAILFAGGSASKVFQIFAHMGLGCHSLRSFFKHQRNQLFPVIHLHWKRYQSRLLDKLKDVKDGLTVAGDARHDSMGHNAKYGAYTILCCKMPKIIHFSLVQRNQAESSNAMEFMGFKNCMNYLLETCGLGITTFVSDRHTTIACHMNKVLTQIKHYFDLWHLKKKIRKVLSKLTKEKACEVLKDWIRPCENHLYWSAQSTHSGDGNLIWAKFKSFFSHVINVHSDLGDPLFNKCAHREIRNRTWLEKGSTAHDKLVTALSKPSLIRGIKQASPLDQTSGLEGFHSVVNYFAPKMIAYSYVGMYSRHILAILHFNSNLYREVKYKADGTEQLRVSYPKFKNGEATVRNVCITQNFDYVEELYDTFLTSSKEEIRSARDELQEMTPSPMNSVLQKQPVAEAIQKRLERRSMEVADTPATTPALQNQAQVQHEVPANRAPPKCRQCQQPMKGHNKVKDCPRNNKT